MTSFAKHLQLLGDSIFRRLVSSDPSVFHEASCNTCISGLTVSELKKLVKSQNIESQYVCVLIGINDITKCPDIKDALLAYKSLVKFLRKRCKYILLCHLLGIARGNEEHGSVKQFNSFIDSFRSVARVYICETSKAFSPAVCGNILFEPTIKNRVDGIHPSSLGIQKLRQCILATMEREEVYLTTLKTN